MSFHTASFGPPVVSIETENNSAIISMKGPTRYQPNHEKPEVDMAALYPQMMYNLSIHNTRRGKMVSSMSHPNTVPRRNKTKRYWARTICFIAMFQCLRQSHVIVNSNLYKHALMEYDTEYCFSARSKFLSMPIQCQSSAWHCVTTPAGRTLRSLDGVQH